MSSKAGPKWFYWLEGVTGRSVRRHLDTAEITVWHQRRTRRALVVLQTLVIAALMLHWLWIGSSKAQTYVGFFLLGCTVMIYFGLRKSIRLLSDAPDELIDERQKTLRDGAHTVAYRLLSVVMVFYILAYIAFDTYSPIEVAANPKDQANFWVFFGISYLMAAGSLPAMVLAWTLPEERA
jgi:hypothetical protein